MGRLTDHYTDGKYFVPNYVLQTLGEDVAINKLGEIEDLEEFIQRYSDVTAISILRGYASNYKGYKERFLNN